MKKLIEITGDQVESFTALGYDVKHYVEISKAYTNGTGKRVQSRPRIMGDAKVTLSLEGKPPLNGKYGAIWPKAKRAIGWTDDPTVVITRHELVSVLKKCGNKDTTMASYLINHSKCVRVVQQ